MSLTWLDLFKAFALGMVEGLTTFVPVSASGHLLLAQRFLGFADGDFGGAFALMIRLGALLGLLCVYFVRLGHLLMETWRDPAARRFVVGVLLAFLPAAILGVLARDLIKNELLNIWIGCFALIVGGAVLLWIDRRDLAPVYQEATGFSLPMYFGIGLAQCLAVVPGVSRSGAVIVAAMLLGADRRAAAEFSFWLAMPTMTGALAYDLYLGHGPPGPDNAILIAIGFAVSFVAAWLVVRTFLDYVSSHGFALFAWWRVFVGTLGLIALALGH